MAQAAAYINDFNLWQNQVPVVVMAGDGDFNVWDDINVVPLADQDESNPYMQPRRRVSEF